MDWDLKVPPWDFAELERADNCSVDLKLGGLGHIMPSDYWNKSRQPMMSSSSSGSSKRPRGGCHIISCSADGCLSDLSKCREYHRRHKVCEVHSKTAVVMVGGREQRFCQQCSRFHLLVEFDEVKRSCRKRLDGHNRRRRKPQPDPQNSGNFPNQQGSRSTSYHQVSNWPMLIKTEEDTPLQHFPVPSRGSYKEARQFPFSQENGKISTSLSSSSNMFDSDCALSLLSSSASIISNGNLSDISVPIGRPPPVPIMRFVGPGQFSNSQASDNMYPNMFPCSVAEDERYFGSHGLFRDRLEGSSDGNSQTLPFTWQ